MASFALAFALLCIASVISYDHPLCDTTWTSLSSPTNIPLYDTLQLTFSCSRFKDKFTLTRLFGYGSSFPHSDVWPSLPLTSSMTSTFNKSITSRIWAGNVFQGLSYNQDKGPVTSIYRVFSATPSTLVISEEVDVSGSQGSTPVSMRHNFILTTTSRGTKQSGDRDRDTENDDDVELTYVQIRSCRENPVVLYFEKSSDSEDRERGGTGTGTGKETEVTLRKRRSKSKSRLSLSPLESESAYLSLAGSSSSAEMNLKNIGNGISPSPAAYVKIGYDGDWTLKGTVDEKALVISLAGLINREGPNLFLLYPANYTFTIVPEVFKFYSNGFFEFEELKDAQVIIQNFKTSANLTSYVVWDRSVRTSLVVAYTIAGLRGAVVVSERQIPLVEKLGLKMVYDLRNKFANWTDLQIYQWAKKEFWSECSRDFIIWLGGECNGEIVPGVADFGMQQKAFFTDLSTKKGDPEEVLANQLMSEMNDNMLVVGWHSYCKDLERDFCTLSSENGGRIHGLNSFPDLAFGHKVPLSAGFEFTNNHSPDPGQPEDKVYLAAVQTDGIGLGSWISPSRGSIFYSWEVTMDDYWLWPTLLEMFYRQMKPKDFLIAALSSPAYQYPKAVPLEKSVAVLKYTETLMKKLDINVMAIMDYSEGSTVTGNTDLTKEVVDRYYELLPSALGLTNGYSPSYTYSISDSNVPLLSYDYYLDENRSKKDAADDLQELASINSRRPYYIVMHVREFSDVSRVKEILEMLPSDYEFLPLDQLLMLASKSFTAKVRYENE